MSSYWGAAAHAQNVATCPAAKLVRRRDSGYKLQLQSSNIILDSCQGWCPLRPSFDVLDTFILPSLFTSLDPLEAPHFPCFCWRLSLPFPPPHPTYCVSFPLSLFYPFISCSPTKPPPASPHPRPPKPYLPCNPWLPSQENHPYNGLAQAFCEFMMRVIMIRQGACGS